MKLSIWALAAVALLFTVGASHAADVEAGEKVFNKCKACHDIEGKNKIGPTLKGVVGRPAGTVEGFNYSPAMKNSGLTWDAATLAEYLKDPKAKVPGNKMAFPGLKDQAELDNVIAFLTEKAK